MLTFIFSDILIENDVNMVLKSVTKTLLILTDSTYIQFQFLQ